MTTVLVVDDERMPRQLLIRTLTGAGLTVIEARDGFHAIDLLCRRWREITAAVVDTEMPGVHGWEVIRFARSKRPTMSVLRLGRADDLVPAREYQVFQRLPVLAKPFTPTELLAAVRSRLRLRMPFPKG